MRRNRHATPYVKADTRKCEACWKCVEACKKQVLGKMNVWFHKHVVIKNAGNCVGCQTCVKTCPNGVFEAVEQDKASSQG